MIASITQAIVGIGTGLAMLHMFAVLAARAVGRPQQMEPPDGPLSFTFVVPCLNEALVIGATIDRLLAVPGDATILVIDDGSTDQTAAIVQSYIDRGFPVRLLRRQLPDAQRGKGEALNAGYRAIVQHAERTGVDPRESIVCIMDADGKIDVAALTEVSGLFREPNVGAVQIGVRIENRETIVGRLQDAEFFVFGSVVQQGRNQIGSVGLGGNGQFTRLAALQTLGARPWSDCLTEDLDLGIRLTLNGWRLLFTKNAWVHQEGLTNLVRLVRQRSRWAQGYFQCWRHIPDILRSPMKWYATADILFGLLWPAVSCLLLPVAILLTWLLVVLSIATSDAPLASWFGSLLIAYLLGISINTLLVLHYRSRTKDMRWTTTIGLIHALALYQFVWMCAGWRAAFRIVTGRRSWAKTERIALPQLEESPAG